ncbi:MAG: hypothetical protein AB1445_10255 [Bacillota bacterium]
MLRIGGESNEVTISLVGGETSDIKIMHNQGLSIREISRQTSRNRKTASKYLQWNCRGTRQGPFDRPNSTTTRTILRPGWLKKACLAPTACSSRLGLSGNSVGRTILENFRTSPALHKDGRSPGEKFSPGVA